MEDKSDNNNDDVKLNNVAVHINEHQQIQPQQQPVITRPIYNNVNVNYRLNPKSSILNPAAADIFHKSLRGNSGTAAGFKFIVNTKGISSSDDPGLDNQFNILQFFQSHMIPPGESIRVYGYHTESYSDTETDSDGNSRSVTKTRTVTDFLYYISLTDYINPIGTMIQPHAAIDSYLSSKASLKELTLRKRIVWDYKLIEETITQRIKALGYTDTIDITFHLFNDFVKIFPNNNLSICARDDLATCLLWITCLCLIWYPIKLCIQDQPQVIYCDYRMNISEQEWLNRYIHLIKIK
jgi:hypothetical protein